MGPADIDLYGYVFIPSMNICGTRTTKLASMRRSNPAVVPYYITVVQIFSHVIFTVNSMLTDCCCCE